MRLNRPSPDNTPLQNGVILSRFAELAYHPAEFCSAAWDVIVPWQNGNAKGLAALHSPQNGRATIVIAIAGTDDFIDVQDDLDFGAAHPRSGRIIVHAGFLRHADDVREAIERLQWDVVLANDDTQVYLVGHSLGASAAILLPEVMHLSDDLEIHTIGGPPAIKQGHGSGYNRIVYRYQDVCDIVPLAFRLVCEHVGRPFFLRLNGKISGSPSIWHRTAAWCVKIARMLFRGPFSTEKHYHSMVRYRKLLEAAA